MTIRVFGHPLFSVTVDDPGSRSTLVADDQIRIRLSGDGWELGGENDETFGIAVPRLVQFSRASATRHWGPFAGLES